ncbi:MAG: thymidine phosphorylase [Verrucomicrobiota bacterium]
MLSIPGFRVGLSQEEAMAQLSEIGVVMMGQTASICPADKKLYALRDVTATVPSEPLIIASILSKKLAESLDRLVLDVKFGSGAFMKTRPEAESLGEGMRVVAEEMGVSTAIRYNPMDEPLGRAVGNALEVSEALEVLRGDGPRDLIEITLDLAEAVVDEERETLASWLRNGRALERFRELVKWQGGDSDCLDRFEAVCPASIVLDVTADRSGEVNAVDADTIGRASVRMGAGRNRAEDQIDFSVGFDHLVKIGQSVSTGEVLGRVHARSESEAESGRDALLQAILIS